MTLAAALFFDSSIFPVHAVSGGQGGINLQESWVSPLNLFDPSGHQFFVLAMIVLSLAVLAVLLVRKGTTGRFLAAMRGSEVGVGGVGINVTWQRVLVFALSGAVAGVGGTLLVLNEQNANPAQFNYQLSMAFVVIVVTVGVTTMEGAIQGAIGFVVIEQLLTYAPPRLQGLSFVLFAAGALTYASHPEGVVEYLKRQSILLIQRTSARSETGGRGNVPLTGQTGLHRPSISGMPQRSVSTRTAAGAEHE